MLSIGVVAAVSRPERIPSVIAAFERQRHENKRLLLCLNGPARDAAATGDCALRCEGGTPARPRNAGLAQFQREGSDIVCFWDDDDYYGPGYLGETVAELSGSRRRVVGKHARFTRFDSGLYYLLGAQDSFLGGTMAGWANELPPVPDLPRDEDRVWCQELARAGFDLRNLTARHYVYNRCSGEHAWNTTKTQMLHAYGPALCFGSADDAIVDGQLRDTSAEFVARPSFDDVSAELLAKVIAAPVDPRALAALGL